MHLNLISNIQNEINHMSVDDHTSTYIYIMEEFEKQEKKHFMTAIFIIFYKLNVKQQIMLHISKLKIIIYTPHAINRLNEGR